MRQAFTQESPGHQIRKPDPLGNASQPYCGTRIDPVAQNPRVGRRSPLRHGWTGGTTPCRTIKPPRSPLSPMRSPSFPLAIALIYATPAANAGDTEGAARIASGPRAGRATRTSDRPIAAQLRCTRDFRRVESIPPRSVERRYPSRL